MVRRFAAMGSCLNFMIVLEYDVDIISAVDGDVIYRCMPVFCVEFGERVQQFLEGLEEGFRVGMLQMHLLKLCHDRLHSLVVLTGVHMDQSPISCKHHLQCE